MIGHERPGQRSQTHGADNGLKAIKKHLPVTVVAEDGAAPEATDGHAVQRTGGVETGAGSPTSTSNDR